jgi:hypothetical protein
MAADETLDGIDRVLRIDHALALGGLADEPLAVLVERHHRGAQAPAFGGRDHGRLAAFHHGDHTVGRTQIDSDNFTHGFTPYCDIFPSIPILCKKSVNAA